MKVCRARRALRGLALLVELEFAVVTSDYKNIEEVLDSISGLDFFDRKIRTSVNVHGLLVPANSLQTRLHIFCQNLVRFTRDDIYQFQLLGSATGLEYGRSRLLVCTAHQVDGCLAEDMGLLLDQEKQAFVSSAGFAGYKFSPKFVENDEHDLCVFNFTEQALAHPELEQRFFRFNGSSSLDDDDNVILYLAFGCPYGDQNYDVVDNNRLGTAIRALYCEPQEQGSDLALGRCRALSGMDFDPNGMSGGAVFAITLDADITLKFAGVINRAGGGFLHFIKATVIKRLLDLATDF